MGRAAVAEEARLVGIGVEPQVLEPADAGAGGALGDIGLEVEHGVARPAARNEEALRRLSGFRESGDELGADFVGRLRDAGTERGRRCASRFAPSRSIAATVASTTPVSAPFQPACAAPTTRASGSANRIMPQSAPVTPSASPGVAVTTPSQRGRASGAQCSETAIASGEWTW